jgi:hypothetical protein
VCGDRPNSGLWTRSAANPDYGYIVHDGAATLAPVFTLSKKSCLGAGTSLVAINPSRARNLGAH